MLQRTAEQILINGASQYGYEYTIVRTGRLKGGGGEYGLGDEFYETPSNIQEVGKWVMFADLLYLQFSIIISSPSGPPYRYIPGT